MLQYVVAISFIFFCNSTARQKTGLYKEIALSQLYSITPFFHREIHVSQVFPGTNKFNIFIDAHRRIFTEQRFIMDGLWAFNSGGKLLTRCVDSSGQDITLNYENLDPNMIQDLKLNWPRLKLHGTDKWSWKDNYDTYGSCVTNNQTFYFEEALRLLNKYNARVIFNEANLYEDNTYSYEHILESVTNVVRKKLFVQCLRSPLTKKQYLLGLTMCFNKDHDLHNCHHRQFRMYECDSGDVIYPGMPGRYL